MTNHLTTIAAALAGARVAGHAVAIDERAIGTLAEAYRVQHDSLARLGGAVGGWKVSASALAGPCAPTTIVGAAILDRHMRASPAEWRPGDFVDAHIECEVAFVLGADLPARARPYTPDEVADAVAAVMPLFEVADSRVGWTPSPLAKIADAVSNGGLVTGAPLGDWRSLDLSAIAIALTRDGKPFATGSSAAVAGGPLGALRALVNAQPLPFPLAAGQVVTTGSCTGMIRMGPGDYQATFGLLGAVSLRIAP